MTTIWKKDDAGATIKMVDVGGYFLPAFPTMNAAELKKNFDNVPTLRMRDDDIMLCTYPKTGTNWMFEILSMMLKGSNENVQLNKFMTMIEAQKPEDMERVPSPRVMNCHMKLKFLPEDLKTKQIKTILVLRNPKDTAVSFFNHAKNINVLDYDGEFKDWLPPYVRDTYTYCKYTDYLWEWHDAIEKGTGFPLHVVYEDLKVNGIEEINKLETFLGLELGPELKQSIMDACHFENMKKTKRPPKNHKGFFKKDFQLLRKGQIGDWKNWFTVQQNEMFDQVWEQETKGLKFSFVYTDPRET